MTFGLGRLFLGFPIWADFLVKCHDLAINYCIVNVERSDRIDYLWKLFSEILLVPREEPGCVPASQRQSAITVKLDLKGSGAGRYWAGQFRFHRLYKVRHQGGTGWPFHDFAPPRLS